MLIGFCPYQIIVLVWFMAGPGYIVVPNFTRSDVFKFLYFLKKLEQAEREPIQSDP